MSKAAHTPWIKVEHSWSDTSIYDASNNPVLTSSIAGDATEENQQELEKKQSEVIDFAITAVNHHQELVTRLKDLVNEFDDNYSEGSYKHTLIHEARETLKKVKQ